MSHFAINGRFGSQNGQGDSLDECLAPDEDLIMEQILENLNTTPIGKVLKRIASLPEVRKKKVLDVRRQLTEGKYDLSSRLDVALDKVLEDFTT
ncbi:MAG: flagellar biosynthesis anti-sigma factor FlgM [Phycisphaerae bacterium]|nr:flagellar biosynthesis anti-sigma factor FlgM [Phycisphaerae bacterium]